MRREPRVAVDPAGRGPGAALGEMPNGLDADAILRPTDRQCQYYFFASRLFQFQKPSQLRIRVTRPRSLVLSTSSHQRHCELVYPPLQFQKRRQYVIHAHTQTPFSPTLIGNRRSCLTRPNSQRTGLSPFAVPQTLSGFQLRAQRNVLRSHARQQSRLFALQRSKAETLYISVFELTSVSQLLPTSGNHDW